MAVPTWPSGSRSEGGVDVTARVLFLGGMGRSGTTLVERMLAGAPGAVALGEVMHMWRRGVGADELCGCGQSFSRCEFWVEVGARAFGGWHRVDLDRVEQLRHAVDHVRHVPALLLKRRSGGFESQRREYAAHYVAVYRAVQELTGAEVLIDSSKQASLPHALAREDIDLRVLHCVRDVRAVCHAWTKEVRRPESVGGESLMTRYSPREMASMWASHNVATELVKRYGVPVRLLRYEDLMRSPTAAISMVGGFAGLSGSPGDYSHVTESSVRLSTDHTAAGNPMRFATGPLALRIDDAWVADMPAGSRRRVTAMTWPLLKRYGYPLGTSHR